MLIREASLNDIHAVIEIDTDITGEAKPQYWQDAFNEYQSHKESRFILVAEQGQQVLGFINGEIRAWEFGSAPCGWVIAIGIRQDERLGGIGSKLLDSLCGYFHRAGVTKARTMITRQNHEVLAFFRSQGMMAGPYLQLEKELE